MQFFFSELHLITMWSFGEKRGANFHFFSKLESYICPFCLVQNFRCKFISQFVGERRKLTVITKICMVSSLGTHGLAAFQGSSFFFTHAVHSIGPVVMHKPKCSHLIAEGNGLKWIQPWTGNSTLISSLPSKSQRIWESILGKLDTLFPGPWLHEYPFILYTSNIPGTGL